jgi:UDP-3-O-[3-hydroxymyristoyl] glucosamine N-acyltransferase
MPELTAAEIAERSGGEVEGDPAASVRGVATLDAAGPGDLSFVSSPRYAPRAAATRAGVILLPRGLACELPAAVTAIRVKDPHLVLAWLLPTLHPEAAEPPGVHPTAIVDPDAEVGADVHLAPYVVVGRGARIGDRVRIGAHAVVGDGCSVGSDTVLHPHVTLYPGAVLGARCVVHSGVRIGVSGPKLTMTAEGCRKAPALGGCRIGDDVEIGANSVIDGGASGTTSLGDGTKLDNLVHVGHDASVGARVLLVAQVTLAEGARVEEGAVIGGQSGVDAHRTVGRGARVAGKSGVTSDVAPGETVSGYPARPHREAMRAQATLFRLPGVLKKLQEIERAVRREG